MRVNLLVMLHGMTLDDEARSHEAEYAALWEALTARAPNLAAVLPPPLTIEWGHELPDVAVDAAYDDQRLMRAENYINACLFPAVPDPSPYHHALQSATLPLSSLVSEPLAKYLLRPLFLRPFMEQMLVRGFADALYYCSPDGERAVRRAIYGQVLQALEPYRGAAEVRLHVLSYSLGVTVAFDFLYGLFAPDSAYGDGVPGFITDNQADPGMAESVAAYRFWREKRQRGELQLGSLVSAGGQLPLMMLRSQRLLNRLAAGEKLEAEIGIRPGDGVKWKIFYDPDDALGFPTRRLFREQAAIQEYEVDTSWLPNRAHTRYWQNERVLREVTALIEANL